MNNNTEKEILSFIKDSLIESKGFITEQAPDVIQQYLMSEMLVYGLVSAFAIILLMICCIAYVWLFKNKQNHREDDWGFIFFLSSFGGVIGIVLLCTRIFSFLTVWLYPKAYLLKQFVL